MMINAKKFYNLALLLVLTLANIAASAAPRIAVLDFELKDLTLAPGIAAEVARTASVKPMLENELRKSGYEIVSIDIAAQHQATAGAGYLFDHSDAEKSWKRSDSEVKIS